MSSGYDHFFKNAKRARSQATANPNAVTSNKRKPLAPPSTAKWNLERPQEAGGRQKSNSHDKPAAKRKSKARFPIAFFVVVPFMAGICLWTNFSWEKLENLLNRVEVRALTIAGASEEATGEGEHKKEKDQGKKSHSEKKESAKNSGSEKVEKSEVEKEKKGWTEEELALFKNLDERKKSLDRRETELTKLEEELQKQKKELDERLKSLDQMRQKIAAQLEEKVQSDQEKVDKLVALYSNMKPQSAAKVLQDLNEDLVVEILGKMKQKSAAEIMNLLAADKAQRLSEKFAGYKRR